MHPPPGGCAERPGTPAFVVADLADPDRDDVAVGARGAERFVVRYAQIVAEPEQGEVARIGEGHEEDYDTETAVSRRDRQL